MQDLRSNNEEELGKERLQTNIFRGTPYGHVALGTVAGIERDHARRREAVRAGRCTRSANLTVGHQRRRAGRDARRHSERRWRALPGRARSARAAVVQGARPSGIEVEILEKDTRATAISFGFPIEVTRAHPDFAALSVARAWLGEHRSSSDGCISASARFAG